MPDVPQAARVPAQPCGAMPPDPCDSTGMLLAMDLTFSLLCALAVLFQLLSLLLSSGGDGRQLCLLRLQLHLCRLRRLCLCRLLGRGRRKLGCAGLQARALGGGRSLHLLCLCRLCSGPTWQVRQPTVLRTVL